MVSSVARPKISVYFDEKVYEWLVSRAKQELRSPANLAEYLITQIYEKESKKDKSQ